MSREKTASAKIVAGCAAICAALAVLSLARAEAPRPFVSQRLPGGGGYSTGIESPAVNAGGAIYAQNFQRRGVIGRWRASAKRSELYARLPVGSFGSGTRFHRDGRMYVAACNTHVWCIWTPPDCNGFDRFWFSVTTADVYPAS
ncbi:MAG: hypothetical protein ACLPSW_23590 [Roseiarcus sp.]